MDFFEFLDQRPYSMLGAERQSALMEELSNLTAHHAAHCPAFHNILEGLWPGWQDVNCIEDVPYLPVSLFKTHDLRSVPETDIRTTLTSSGTTGQNVSKIFVDAETSIRQQKGLSNSLTHVLGKKRLPMLVIDTDAVFKDPRKMSARGAGVLGMMRYGRAHAFALTSDLEPDIDAVRSFLEKNGDAPFFMFGFTYMVWARFYQTFVDDGLDLSNGILIHSGGWKKMVEQAVDNSVFRKQFEENFSLTRIYNFYGMVEQLGSIFLEGPDGLLYPPNFSEVIIRDPKTFEPAAIGQPGIIQVLSIIPKSYPGCSLLTEDLGVIEAVDSNKDGWNGAGIRVLGRVPKAELRGCSDVISKALGA